MVKKIIKNFTALFTGEVIARLCHFVSVVYIARMLGAAGFGAINFALAVISYFLMATNLGLGELGVREVARKHDVREMAGTILSMRLSIALISFAVVLIMAVFLNKSPSTIYLIVAYGFTLFPYALSVEWVFRGIEQMKYNAYGRIINAILYVGLIFLVVKKPQDILKVAMITILADFVSCIFYYANYTKKFGPIRFHFDLKKWFSISHVSAQLFFSSALLTVYLGFGTVALGFMKNEEAVGFYGAAYKLILVFYAISDVFVAAIFPVASRLYHESKERLQEFIRYCVKAALSLGMPIAVGGLLLGPRIIKLIYGSSYGEAGPLLQIISWFAAINLTSYALSYLLVACDRQHIYLAILGCGTAFNIVFNLVAIRFIGYYAPSIALVLTETIILIMSFIAMRKLVALPIARLSIKPLASAVFMGGMILVFFKLNIVALVGLAAILYLGALFAIGGITKVEVEKVREAF